MLPFFAYLHCRFIISAHVQFFLKSRYSFFYMVIVFCSQKMSNNASSPMKLPLKRSSLSTDDIANKKIKLSSSLELSQTACFNDSNPIACKFADIKKMLLWLVLSAISFFLDISLLSLIFAVFNLVLELLTRPLQPKLNTVRELLPRHMLTYLMILERF